MNTTTTIRAYRLLATSLSLGALVACSDPVGTDTPAGGIPTPIAKQFAGIRITPEEDTFLEGFGRQLQIEYLAMDGTPTTPRPTTWASSDTLVAVVAADGMVRARRPGRAVISALAEGKRAEATIQVEADSVVRITMSHTIVGLAFGQTVQLGATAIRRSGGWADVEVVWTSSDPEIISIDARGRATALRPGSSSIKARVGEVVGEIYVSAAGPVMAGSWTLSVGDLTGGGTICWMNGVHLQLTAQGNVVSGGTAAWSQPTVFCDVEEGAEPPYTSPAGPVGTAHGWLSGAAFRLTLQGGWTLHGDFVSADRIEGNARYSWVDETGAHRSSEGRFQLRRN